MFCQQCGNNIKEGAAFCGNCGWAVQAAVMPIEKKCASCGTVLKDEAQFCPNCGQAVTAVSAQAYVEIQESHPDPVCSSCGEKIIQGNNFCIKCGTPVNTASVPYTPPPTSIKQDEPESILLKAMVTAQEQSAPFAENNGNLIITNKRIVFTSSRLLNADLLGEIDSDLSFYYNEIAEVKSTKYNLVFPAVEITAKNGYKIKFGGYGKIKTAYEIICERMKSYA